MPEICRQGKCHDVEMFWGGGRVRVAYLREEGRGVFLESRACSLIIQYRDGNIMVRRSNRS